MCEVTEWPSLSTGMWQSRDSIWAPLKSNVSEDILPVYGTEGFSPHHKFYQLKKYFLAFMSMLNYFFLKNPGGRTASLCHAILDGTYNTSGPQFHELSYKGEHFPCQLLSSRRNKIHKCILRTLQLSNQEPERSFTDLLRTVTTLSMSQFKFSSFYFRQLVYLVSLWFCLFVLSLNNIFKDEVYKYAYYYKRNYFLS